MSNSLNPANKRTEPDEKSEVDFIALLVKAFTTPGNQSLLQQVRDRSAEAFDYLDDERLEQDSLVHQAIEEHPSWAGEVFAALAHDPSVPKSELDAARSLIIEAEAGEATAGVAFAHCLCAGLPAELRDWPVYFGSVKTISKRAYRNLLDEPSVRCAESAEKNLGELLWRGITPLTIMDATKAVWLSMNNLRHNYPPEVFGAAGFITSLPGPVWHGFKADCATVLTSEIANSAEVSREAGRALLRWLVDVAPRKPHVFRGYFAEPVDTQAMSLRPAEETVDLPLVTLWTLTERYAVGQAKVAQARAAFQAIEA